jgi:hypothetical protein
LIQCVVPLLGGAAFRQLVFLPDDANDQQDDDGRRNDNGGEEEPGSTDASRRAYRTHSRILGPASPSQLS